LIAGETGGTLILAQASTACSTRLRGDANGYGLITTAPERIEIEIQGWTGETFHPLRRQSFCKRSGSWRRTVDS
jgi:hypothetical protein